MQEKILLAVSKNEDWMNKDNEYVQQLETKLEMLLTKHSSKYLFEKEGVDFYEIYIR